MMEFQRKSFFILVTSQKLKLNMKLIVKNREKTIYEGEVDTVTSYNKVGIFNVLQDHANFISIVQKKILLQKRGSTEEIVVENGLMKVKNNEVKVYVGVK